MFSFDVAHLPASMLVFLWFAPSAPIIDIEMNKKEVDNILYVFNSLNFFLFSVFHIKIIYGIYTIQTLRQNFLQINRDHTRQNQQNVLYTQRRLGAARAFVQSDRNLLF